jgi:hypothetical protein
MALLKKINDLKLELFSPYLLLFKGDTEYKIAYLVDDDSTAKLKSFRFDVNHKAENMPSLGFWDVTNFIHVNGRNHQYKFFKAISEDTGKERMVEDIRPMGHVKKKTPTIRATRQLHATLGGRTRRQRVK